MEIVIGDASNVAAPSSEPKLNWIHHLAYRGGMLTTAAAAHTLGVSKTAVQRAADEGRLPCQRAADGSRLFDENAVAVWAQQRKAGCRRGQPRRPTDRANLAANAGPTEGPSLSPPSAAQIGYPDAGAVSDAQVDPRLRGANAVEANPVEAAAAAQVTWTARRFEEAYGLLDLARSYPDRAFGGLVALWPSIMSPQEIEALGDQAKRCNVADERNAHFARSTAECLTCLGFGGRPLWARMVRDTDDRCEIDAACYRAPAGRTVVPCDRCPGPPIVPDREPAPPCPVCSGSGLTPEWTREAFIFGCYDLDLRTPSSWGPTVCRACQGWGSLAPILAVPTKTASP